MSYFDDFQNDYDSIDQSLDESNTYPQRKKRNRKPLFTRGYQESRQRLNKNPYYTRSCFNCADYYQASGDKEEVCQNPDVLQYDMVVSDNNVYCLKWRPSSSVKTEQQSLFRKNGRSKLD